MPITLTNSSIIIPKSELTPSQLQRIKKECTYQDQSVSYAIKRLSNSPWGKSKVEDLKSKLIVTLYEEDDDFIILPQGFKYLLPSSVPTEDKRVLPKIKPMLWHKKPDKTLRYYQREMIDALKSDTRGQGVAATGSGKTFVLLNLAKEMGLKTLIICPSSMIGQQLYEDFSNHLGKKYVSMYGSGKKEVKQITIGLFQSVTKNIELFKDFEMVIIDESQFLAASSLVAISRGLSHVPYFYSVSATNWRSDGKTPEIYAASGDVKYRFDTERAIKERFLAKPAVIMREIPSSGREYDLKQKNYRDHVLKNNILTEQIIKDAEKARSLNMSTLILVQEIEHGEIISKRLGVPFANGENKDSMKLIKQLNEGTVKTLVAGASMAGVGCDTVRVDCLMMVSFPGTEGLTLQLLGRGLRKYEGKEKVLVLDYILPNSPMLLRHAKSRIEWYRRLGDVKIIKSEII